MGRAKRNSDEDEAAAAVAASLNIDPETPFARQTRERQEAAAAAKSVEDGKRRKYEARLEADIRKTQHALADKVSAVLLAEFKDADAVEMMMRDIRPILALGKEGRRRERPRVLPASTATAA